MVGLGCPASRLALCLLASLLLSIDPRSGESPGSQAGTRHSSREGRVDVGVEGGGDFAGGATESRSSFDIAAFLEATNYTTRSPRAALPVHNDEGGRGCIVVISSPKPGHNGDAAAAPRVARTRAWVEAHVQGQACVQADRVALRQDVEMLLLVSSASGFGVWARRLGTSPGKLGFGVWGFLVSSGSGSGVWARRWGASPWQANPNP